jgi:predicted CXXCH cytochrome family protein
MFKKLAGLTAVAGLFIAGTASADIAGSVHDFRTTLGMTDLCAVCHTAHNDTSGIADAPLWDHTVTTTQYVPYTSDTMQSLPNDPTPVDPSGVSALCLSCHDGTVAVDAYGGSAGDPANQIDANAAWTGVGAGMIDNNMSSEHPISMSYAAADTSFQASPLDGVPLFSGNVECASCHDVHNQSGNAALLINTNAGSELCLDCHIK